LSHLTTEQLDSLFDLIRTMSLTDYLELKRRLALELGICLNIDFMDVSDVDCRLAGDPMSPHIPHCVVLVDAGPSRLHVIKTIRSLTNLTPQEAKRLVDEVPSTIGDNLEVDQATRIGEKLAELGAAVEIRKYWTAESEY
jgi:ribosomal protein L7/L12